MNEIASVIASVGFPIVACIGLAFYINKQLENFRKAIENNTLAISALLAYLKKDGDT